MPPKESDVRIRFSVSFYFVPFLLFSIFKFISLTLWYFQINGRWKKWIVNQSNPVYDNFDLDDQFKWLQDVNNIPKINFNLHLTERSTGRDLHSTVSPLTYCNNQGSRRSRKQLIKVCDFLDFFWGRRFHKI